MNDPTRQTVKELLDLALEQTGAERAALLDRECSDNTELRKEVEELIRALESRDGFLESPALELDVEWRVRSGGLTDHRFVHLQR